MTLTDVGPGILNYYKATDYASHHPFRINLKGSGSGSGSSSSSGRRSTYRTRTFLGPGRRGDSEVDVFANSDLMSFCVERQGRSRVGLGTRAATRRELEVVRCTHCTLSYSSSLHVHTLNLCIQCVRAGRSGFTSCPCGRFALLMALAQ